jgi:hypothetical protein
LKILIKKIYYKNYKFQKTKLLGRVACLGSEVISKLDLQKGLVNHQKSRVDFLLEVSKNPNIKPTAKDIYPFLKKKYIFGTIEQQESDFFLFKKPDYIFMDSFSELTDQLFVDKINGKHFLANYSDINHDENFNNRFYSKGLVEISDLSIIFDDFFNKVSVIYPDTIVIFIHFPTIFDKRKKFQERGNNIIKIINELSKKYHFLNSISLDDEFVFKSEDESDELKDFPYHYGKATYEKFAEIIKGIINV